MENNITSSSELQVQQNLSFAKLPKKPNTFSSCAQVFYLAGSEHSCLNCFIVLKLELESSNRHSYEVINEQNNAQLTNSNNDNDDSIRNVVSSTGVNAQENANKKNKKADQSAVNLIWTHPYSAETVMSLYPHLGRFALANAGTSYSADQLNYTFVLTNSNGMREYGHTTAFVNGEAVVAISPYPWCNFFYHLAYLYSCNGEENGRRIVRALTKCGTPPSGAEFLTPLELGISFKRPYDRLCAFIDTNPLSILSCFADIDLLFLVLADLLLEKHIVVVGPNFSIVSNVIMSLQALISPFDWMHILIPILPSNLIDVLAAPPPYFVGMLHSQLPLLHNVNVDSIVLIYLDIHGVCTRVEHHNETIDTLPYSGALSALRIGLNLLKYRHRRDQTVRDLCSLFMTYYASTFGEVVLQGARVSRSKLNQHTSSAKSKFYSRLLSTQSFNILSEEVRNALNARNMSWMDNEFIVAIVREHRELYPEHYDTLIAEEREGKSYVSRHGDCFGSHETFTSWTAAVHGFGGHRLSVPRLIGHCMWSSLTSHKNSSQQRCYYSHSSSSSSSTAATLSSALFPSESPLASTGATRTTTTGQPTNNFLSTPGSTVIARKCVCSSFTNMLSRYVCCCCSHHSKNDEYDDDNNVIIMPSNEEECRQIPVPSSKANTDAFTSTAHVIDKDNLPTHSQTSLETLTPIQTSSNDSVTIHAKDVIIESNYTSSTSPPPEIIWQDGKNNTTISNDSSHSSENNIVK